jgi:hypothetical protein
MAYDAVDDPWVCNKGDDLHAGATGDRKALIQVLQKVSALVEIIPELQDLDLNPIKILEPGRGVVAVDARMRIAP